MDNLIGIAYPQWRQLRRETKNDVDPPFRSLARRLTVMSLIDWWRGSRENRVHGDAIARLQIPAPVFVIGHWRSGTTLLHTLLAQDEQFAYPRRYQVSNPHTFLSISIKQAIERQIYETRRRPINGIEFDGLSPAEDEFATCPMSIRSHMVSWSFLRQEPFYDRFLTFRQATPEEYEAWRKAFLWFLRKVVYKENRRRPLLKSPQHTARVGLLLKEFPDARFVHIHRDPRIVYRSTENMYQTGILPFAFQQLPGASFLTEGILRHYREMYDAFLEDRKLIPAGQYVEIAFEEFERDMLSGLAHIYEELRLYGYAQAESNFRVQLQKIANDRRATHPELEPALRQRLYTTWRRSFDEWGYQA